MAFFAVMLGVFSSLWRAVGEAGMPVAADFRALVWYLAVAEPLFGGMLRLALFTILPAGFAAYVPVRVVQAPSIGDVLLLVMSSCAYLWLAATVFELGLRRYASGSRFSTLG